jgi:fumarate reductase flavoprotein subunit
MTEKSSELSRRQFIAASSAAIATPLVMKMAGMVPDAEGAEKEYSFIDRKSCDVVVLGGGYSGMVAAVRAAQLSGKKVIVLEKSAATKGFPLGGRFFGSKWQEKRNLPNPIVEYARDMMDLTYWRLDHELVLNCLLGTGQYFDWLCELGGDIDNMFTVGTYVHPTENDPLGPQPDRRDGKSETFFADLMKEKCKAFGVEVLTKHPVVDIEVKNGKIAAAIAKSESGYVRIECRACIMAIGSWINNEEILKKYCPKFVGMKQYMDPSLHMNPTYTGDGVSMAEKVGAFVDYDSFCLRLMGPIYDYARDVAKTSKVFLTMTMSPYIITVNLNGKRYCAEPVSHIGMFNDGHVQIEQPHGQSYDIFDQNTLAAAFKLHKWKNPVGEFSLPDTMEEINKSINEGFAKSNAFMFKGNTLEELADNIGPSLNKKNFLETVKKYNESCEKGADWNFFKDKSGLVPINKPPFYAMFGKLMTDGAFGGVLVNPEIQAYKRGGGLIEGLYVTGDFASGRFINLGGVKRQVINDRSWALSGGFLAGTNVCKYLKGMA